MRAIELVPDPAFWSRLAVGLAPCEGGLELVGVTHGPYEWRWRAHADQGFGTGGRRWVEMPRSLGLRIKPG